MRKGAIAISVACTVLGILACGLPAPAQTPTAELPQLETLVAEGMLTAQPSAEATLAPAETAPPTAQLCLPVAPPALGVPAPAGLTASAPDSGVLRFVNFEGQEAASRSVPGLAWPRPEEVHIAGGAAGVGLAALPVVYRTFEDMGTLMLSVDDSLSMLMHTPELIAMAGAPGSGVISYSLNESGPQGWISHLYVAALSDFPDLEPVLTRDEGDGYVLLPLAVRASTGNVAQGVWFTNSMYGIGDLIFRPYRGLYYLDLASGQVSEFLDFDQWISAMSPDQSWVAYRPSPPVDGPGLILRNLLTCEETPIALHEGSTFGAGFAVFSPDNQHVAWIEASGETLEGVEARLRVATTEGVIVADAHMDNLYGLAGGEDLFWLTPAGWVDNSHLLVELSLVEYDNRLLVRCEADFHNPVLMTEGDFSGFFYP